jgi:phosphomannomutase
MKIDPSVFKDYDIRAVAGEQLDTAGVERIGRALADHFEPQVVALGRDMRVTGKEWFEALSKGLTDSGVDVIDLGLIATDMIYYAAGTKDVDLVVMISVSHNPHQYNGMKIVKRGAKGVSGESGIYQLRDLVVSDKTFDSAKKPGSVTSMDVTAEFIDHALSMVDNASIKPLKVVVDAGNGMAGKFMPLVDQELPIEVVPLYFELDGTFPNHLANPLLEEAREDAIAAIKEHQADLGILFDGDGDRMFLLDETGRFISGTITTAMVAKQILKKEPGSMILYNAICGRVVPETVETLGGRSQRVRASRGRRSFRGRLGASCRRCRRLGS